MNCATKLKLASEELDAIMKAKRGQTVGEVLALRDKPGRPDNDSKNENGINVRGGNNLPYRIAKLKRDYSLFSVAKSWVHSKRSENHSIYLTHQKMKIEQNVSDLEISSRGVGIITRFV